jgi:hypothetical protein
LNDHGPDDPTDQSGIEAGIERAIAVKPRDPEPIAPDEDLSVGLQGKREAASEAGIEGRIYAAIGIEAPNPSLIS